MSETKIRESFRGRRVSGGLLVFLALPLTLIWARFGLPLRYEFADIIFILGGPGLLLLGLWIAFPRRAPRVLLCIAEDRLVVLPPGRSDRPVVMQLDELTQVVKNNPISKDHRLTFHTADDTVDLQVYTLTHTYPQIINLVSIRLEQMGKYLQEGTTDVLGARNGIWEVREGNPFAKTR